MQRSAIREVVRCTVQICSECGCACLSSMSMSLPMAWLKQLALGEWPGEQHALTQQHNAEQHHLGIAYKTQIFIT